MIRRHTAAICIPCGTVAGRANCCRRVHMTNVSTASPTINAIVS